MKQALRALVYVMLAITCIDFAIWIVGCYWRNIGKREIDEARVKGCQIRQVDGLLKDSVSAENLDIRQNSRLRRVVDSWNNKLRTEK